MSSNRLLERFQASPLIGKPPSESSSACSVGGCVNTAPGGRKTPPTTRPSTWRGGKVIGMFAESTRRPFKDRYCSRSGEGTEDDVCGTIGKYRRLSPRRKSKTPWTALGWPDRKLVHAATECGGNADRSVPRSLESISRRSRGSRPSASIGSRTRQSARSQPRKRTEALI